MCPVTKEGADKTVTVSFKCFVTKRYFDIAFTHVLVFAHNSGTTVAGGKASSGDLWRKATPARNGKNSREGVYAEAGRGASNGKAFPILCLVRFSRPPKPDLDRLWGRRC